MKSCRPCSGRASSGMWFSSGGLSGDQLPCSLWVRTQTQPCPGSLFPNDPRLLTLPFQSLLSTWHLVLGVTGRRRLLFSSLFCWDCKERQQDSDSQLELQAVPLIDFFCFLQSSKMCRHPFGAAFPQGHAGQLSSINELRLKARASLFTATAGD